jgi:cathepsin D
VPNGLLTGQVSGIMGLGFQGISVTGGVPFWQNLINQNLLTSPEFSIFLSRFDNDPNAKTE